MGEDNERSERGINHGGEGGSERREVQTLNSIIISKSPLLIACIKTPKVIQSNYKDFNAEREMFLYFVCISLTSQKKNFTRDIHVIKECWGGYRKTNYMQNCSLINSYQMFINLNVQKAKKRVRVRVRVIDLFFAFCHSCPFSRICFLLLLFLLQFSYFFIVPEPLKPPNKYKKFPSRQNAACVLQNTQCQHQQKI